jgi:predicted kinase
VRGRVTTIVDGTHRQPDRRTAVRTIAAAYGLPTVAVVLVVPLEHCLVRHLGRPRRVPAGDIEIQYTAITAALPELHREGYAAVVTLTTAASH